MLENARVNGAQYRITRNPIKYHLMLRHVQLSPEIESIAAIKNGQIQGF